MKTYFVDCWEQAIRFRTIEVEADSVVDVKIKAELALLGDKVDFEGAEWNFEHAGIEDIWEEEP